jgi:hypothetical protein
MIYPDYSVNRRTVSYIDGGYETIGFGAAPAVHFFCSLEIECVLNGGEVAFFVTQVSV